MNSLNKKEVLENGVSNGIRGMWIAAQAYAGPKLGLPCSSKSRAARLPSLPSRFAIFCARPAGCHVTSPGPPVAVPAQPLCSSAQELIKNPPTRPETRVAGTLPSSIAPYPVGYCTTNPLPSQPSSHEGTWLLFRLVLLKIKFFADFNGVFTQGNLLFAFLSNSTMEHRSKLDWESDLRLIWLWLPELRVLLNF